MTRYIYVEQTVSRCSTCQRLSEPHQGGCDNTRSQRGRGRVDILTYKANEFLLVADYSSKYVELQRLTDKIAATVIKAMKSIFSWHGIPYEIVCDNMLFESYRMNNFAKEWGFAVTTTSPNYPQSNGFAEQLDVQI